MRAALFALLGLLIATPVLAAEKTAPGEGAPGTNLDLPVVIAPITVDGKLTGYAYVQSRLTGATAGDVIAVRDKIAFVLDAFVRDVNATPVTMASDPNQVDKDGLARRMLADARRIMGAGHVKSVMVTDVQIGPLHPTQTVSPSAPPPEPAAPAKAADAAPAKP
jgi:hypothetical protein